MDFYQDLITVIIKNETIDTKTFQADKNCYELDITIDNILTKAKARDFLEKLFAQET